MSAERDEMRRPTRVPTGIPGLDEILRGGLFCGGVYIVMGMPGAGKTMLANQFAFAHARAGGRVVYATLLSESHGRLLSFLAGMRFFDPAEVGKTIQYLNGYAALEGEGLGGLLKAVRGMVRDASASLLVIDGMLASGAIGRTDLEYKKFVQELQTWVEMLGCTVVILTSASGRELRPEYTMVDGIVELEVAAVGARRERRLTVVKLRGSGFLEGTHAYEITDEGVSVYPRVEARYGRAARAVAAGPPLSLGNRELDRLFGGGLPRGSSTLVLGSAGSGKTAFGCQFLAAGLDAGEKALHFAFHEDPAALAATGDALGLRFGERLRSGQLGIRWRPSVEGNLDRLGNQLVAQVARSGAARVFVDGLEAIGVVPALPRLAPVWAALAQEMGTRGVTLVLSAEAATFALAAVDAPAAPGVAAIVDNVVMLAQVQRAGRIERTIAIPKMRGVAHELTVTPYGIGPGGLNLPRARRAAPPARGRAKRGR